MINTKATNNNVCTSKETVGLNDKYDIILYTSATHGGIWLFYIISGANFLIKKLRSERNDSPKPIHVKIILLPVGSFQQNPLTSLLVRVLKKILIGLPYSIKNRLPDRLKSIARVQKQSFYHQIYSGKKVQLELGQDTLTFTRFNTLSVKYTLLFFRSYIMSIFLWLRCYERKRFVAQKLLTLHYQDIRIGDLIASTTLREKPQLAGALKPCFTLFQNLTNAICMCNLCKSLPLNKNKQNYTLFHETTYIHNAYQKTLHYLGANVLEIAQYNKNFNVVTADQPYVNGWIVQQPVSRSCQPADMKRVEDYMRIRLYQAAEKLVIMGGNQNDNLSTEIKDLSGNIIPLNAQKLYAVIFLHSFEDSQYWFGPDGFDDIYHWATFSIDHCLKNSSIDKVLIKPHPAEKYERGKTDDLALQNLIQRYGNNKRVVFIDKFSSLVFFAQNYHIFGITHHGSVAEELVYLHQPVIASVFAPWHTNFSFVRTWNNPEEYERILNSLSLETWSPPSKSEQESLFTFILEYRLNDYRMMCTFQPEKSLWSKISLAFTGRFMESNVENYLKVDKLVMETNSEDQAFQKCINLLIEST